MAERLQLACVDCGANLTSQQPLACPNCGRTFEVVDGIPLLFTSAERERQRQSLDQVHEYYRRVAPRYGREHHVDMPGAMRFLTQYQQRIAPHLTPTSRVLEIGAGTGFATRAIARVTPPLVTDASVEMLSLNRRTNPTLTAFCCSTEALPFTDESFDVVLGNNTFYLVSDKMRGAAEISRVLRRGGKLVLSEMNPYNPLWTVMFGIKGRQFERSIYDIFPDQIGALFAPVSMVIRELDFFSHTPYFARGAFVQLGRVLDAVMTHARPLRQRTAIRIWYVLEKLS